MRELLIDSPLLCTAVTLVCYYMLDCLQRRLKLVVLNPLLLCTGLMVALLVYLDLDYDVYYANTEAISLMLTPVTVALAVPLYERFALLRRNFLPILAGVICGSVLCMGSILLLSALFDVGHTIYVTLLPKSITNAMATGVSEVWGGVLPITAGAVAITGISGNLGGVWLLRLLHVTDPLSRGIALGSGSHAIGTVRAIELGETEGAMSGLAIVLMGLATVVLGNFFVRLY